MYCVFAEQRCVCMEVEKSDLHFDWRAAVRDDGEKPVRDSQSIQPLEPSTDDDTFEDYHLRMKHDIGRQSCSRENEQSPLESGL